MDALLVHDLIRETCYTILKIGAPILLVSLSVGFVISLFQALTQVQEATVSFVPKLMAILLTLIFAFPYMSHTLMTFAHRTYDLITVRPFSG
jgi:flagellar biosynthetic protein FliQ